MPNTATDTGMSTAFKLRLAIAFMVLVVAFGMFGFMYLEGMRPLDGLYMTVITLSTVGFQEVKPLHDASRVFVIVLIILGVVQGGFLVSLFGQLVLEGHFKEIVLRRKMEQKLKKTFRSFYYCRARSSWSPGCAGVSSPKSLVCCN